MHAHTWIGCHGLTRYTGSGVTCRHEIKGLDAMGRHGILFLPIRTDTHIHTCV